MAYNLTHNLADFQVILLTSKQFGFNRLVRCQKVEIEIPKTTQLIKQELHICKYHLVAVANEESSRKVSFVEVSHCLVKRTVDKYR